MSSNAPSMPLFGDAYLADTRHLSLEEHGAYLQLMMIAWRSEGCALPNDDARLARMLGVTAGRWAKLKPTIMAFWSLDGSTWKQKRLTKERAFVDEKRAKNKSAAEARWNGQAAENIEPAECERSSERNAPPPPPPPPIEEGSEAKASSPTPTDDCQEIVTAWNAMAAVAGLAKVNRLTDARRRGCRARIGSDGKEAILLAIESVPKSDFLLGVKGDWSGASFDFLLRPDSVTKILEGKYDGRNNSHLQSSPDRRDGVARALDRELARHYSPADGQRVDGDGGRSGGPVAYLAAMR